MVQGRELTAHQCAGNNGGFSSSSCVSAPVVGSECCCVSLESGQHSVSCHVSHGRQGSSLDQASFDLPDGQIYSGEEECFGGPAQSSRPGSYLLPRVFEAICGVFGRPYLELFVTHANAKLPLYVYPVPDPMTWKQDVLQHPWDHLSAYAFPPFSLLRQVLSRVLLSTGLLLVLVVPFVAREREVRRPLVPVGQQTTRASAGEELTGADQA